MERLKPLFPEIAPDQWRKLEAMAALHREWNARINLVSRKDIASLEWHHYAPCLALLRLAAFAPGARVLDAGTGGGFPGLILAVLFPQTRFTLADSVGKKITVVADIAARLALPNVSVRNLRVETLPRDFDFVTGRAVASLPQFIALVSELLRPGSTAATAVSAVPPDADHACRQTGEPPVLPPPDSLENGILYWQGGALDLEEQRLGLPPAAVLPLEPLLNDPHFHQKHILHYPALHLSRALHPPPP